MEEEKKQKRKRKLRFALSDRMFFEQLPFLLFLTLLGILYITNSYNVEEEVRDIEKLKKAIIEQKNEFVITKTKVSLEGQRSEIRDKVDTLGIMEASTPPFVIELKE
jgi:hypothetical protein